MTSEGTEETAYIYDGDGRLIQSERDGELTEYAYDGAGNRIRETIGDIETTYSYNGFNQLTDEVRENTATGDNISVVSYEYDLRGNLIRERDGEDSAGDSVSREYEYYASGSLRSVAVCGDVVQSNVYDAGGIRIARTENGSSTYYYYGDSGILYSEGAADNTYIRGIEGNVDAAYLGDDYMVYADDVQGSTYSLIDEDLERDVTYTYSDFGETEGSGETSNEICYTGAVYDGTTGMYYMNARYYDLEEGRFISQDTYRGEDTDAGTWHLYAYCNGNPINYTDPSGHFAFLLPAVGSIAELSADMVIYKILEYLIATIAGVTTLVSAKNLKSKVKVNKSTLTDIKFLVVGIKTSLRKGRKKGKSRNKHKHHIIAQKDKRAMVARKILYDNGHTVNYSRNLVYLKGNFHRHLHRNTYFNGVNAIVGLSQTIAKKAYKLSGKRASLSKLKEKGLNSSLTCIKGVLLTANGFAR